MNLMEVVNVLYMLQLGVLKQIKDFEDELGVDIFIWCGKWLMGLMEFGKVVYQLIEWMLFDVENLCCVVCQFVDQDSGYFVVVMMYMQVCYVLLKVIWQFIDVFLKVYFVLCQGSLQQIVQMILNGEVDFGILIEVFDCYLDIVMFLCYLWYYMVVVLKGYLFVGCENLMFEEIVEYLIIMYDQDFMGCLYIDQVFMQVGVVFDVVLIVIDVDVIKIYVEFGMGIGVVVVMVYDLQCDMGFVVFDMQYLFEVSMMWVGLCKGVFLCVYVYWLIEMFVLYLNEVEIVGLLCEVV